MNFKHPKFGGGGVEKFKNLRDIVRSEKTKRAVDEFSKVFGGEVKAEFEQVAHDVEEVEKLRRFLGVNEDRDVKKRKRRQAPVKSIPNTPTSERRGRDHTTTNTRLTRGLASVKDVPGEVRRTTPIPLRVQEYAILAEVAYGDGYNDRLNRLNDRVAEIGSQNKFILQKKGSTPQIAVFEERETGNIVSSFKGTNDLYDLATDLYIILNIETLSVGFQKVNADWQKIYLLWPTRKHVLTGHSLGGAFATFVESKNKGKVYAVYTFNMGSSVSVSRAALKGRDAVNTNEANIVNYFIRGDPLSNLGRLKKSNNVIYPAKPGSSNPHTITQFIEPKFILPSMQSDSIVEANRLARANVPSKRRKRKK